MCRFAIAPSRPIAVSPACLEGMRSCLWYGYDFTGLNAPASARVLQLTLPPITEVEREKLQEVI
jgi:hypothetical protein